MRGNTLTNTDNEYQKSDTLILGALLSLSGGFQDAYTYVLRGNVFANAQTGNVVLMSRYIMTGNWGEALQYIFPIVAFAIGILAAEQIGYRFKDSVKIHWRQIILIIEIIVLTAVAFLPTPLICLPMSWSHFPAQCRFRHSGP